MNLTTMPNSVTIRQRWASYEYCTAAFVARDVPRY